MIQMFTKFYVCYKILYQLCQIVHKIQRVLQIFYTCSGKMFPKILRVLQNFIPVMSNCPENSTCVTKKLSPAMVNFSQNSTCVTKIPQAMVKMSTKFIEYYMRTKISRIPATESISPSTA